MLKVVQREFKFRAWDLELKVMHEVEKINFMEREITVNMGVYLYVPIPLSRVILMQYIGVKDMRGVEIYEADVVKWFNNFKQIARMGTIECDIEDGLRFGIRCHRDNDSIWNFDHADNIEVVGNPYKNPELTKKVRC